MNYSNITLNRPTYNLTPYTNNNNIYAKVPTFEMGQESRQDFNSKFQDDKFYCDGMASIATKLQRTDISQLGHAYFSKENIARIQKGIKKKVLEESNGQFYLKSDQDESDLLLAMQKVYEANGQNLPYKINRQVKRLNKMTLEYIVPDMMTNIKQYYGYMKDINRPLQTIPRPLQVNNAGRKQLPSTTSIWK